MSYTNARQVIPPLFQEIVKNDAERSRLWALPAIPFKRYCGLMRERADFTRAAEKALAWNTNKGAVA